MSGRRPAGSAGAGHPEDRHDGRMAAIVGRLARHGQVHCLTTIRQLTEAERRTLDVHWPLWAHDGQLPGRSDWDVWLIRAGRGFGKTRAGAEWAHAYARRHAGARIALVGGTIAAAAGDLVELIEGCDRTLATCAGWFANAANFRGEPHLPGMDLVTRWIGG